MGNTNSSSSVHSMPNGGGGHHHKARSLRSQQTGNSSNKLKRFGSSATLAKLYQHHNVSSATIPTSKAIAWKNQHGERILDIGKPTKFEHGIHVEYDDDSGKFMVCITLCLFI